MSRFAQDLSKLLNLPLVCRQLYVEVIEHIYKRITFSFSYDEAVLLPTLSVFPQKHLDMLRSLDLKFYTEVIIKD